MNTKNKKHNVIPSAAWESIKQTLFYRINFIYGSSRELAFAQDDTTAWLKIPVTAR